MPKVSVIVPVYNVEKYLNRCVDSILSQTLTDFELILVDDGSVDMSGKICDEYCRRDGRIRVIHKDNGGVSSARNIGLDIATGEFIVFVDSDDYLKPMCFELLVSAKSDLSICGGYKVLENNQVTCTYEIASHDETVSNEKIVTWFEDGYLGVVWGKAFRRDLVEIVHLRFSVDMQYGEDTVFVMEYISHCKTVAFFEEQLYVYVKYNFETLTKSCSHNSVVSYDLLDKYLTHFFITNHVISTLFNSIHYSSKCKMKWAFFNIYESENLSLKDKYKWYKLFFSLKSFNKNIDIMFAEYPKKFRIILRTRNPVLLCLFQFFAKLIDLINKK